MKQSKLWKHVAALLYDIFPILGIFLITSLFLVLLRGGDEVQPGTIWLQLLLLIEVYLYFTYSWLKGGQTLGMRAWKLGIQNHHTMTWAQGTARFLVGLLSTALLGAGLWARRFDVAGLTWMDRVCQRPVISLETE
ncbi:RDD family protein [Marinicella meishanensis]|uniref:RDD family protein n=1 Tax=Marinicella meishanensis TaxID=2873263 RepID=UPI001CBB89CD|nr:RDD family protein [Marinicella sp. NBU2979]